MQQLKSLLHQATKAHKAAQRQCLLLLRRNIELLNAVSSPVSHATVAGF